MKKLLLLAVFFLLYACGSSTSDATSYLSLYTTTSGTLTINGGLSGSLCSTTSGTSPLGVFFSAVGTVSTVTSPANDSRAGFHQIYYAWNFADAGSGNWAYGALAAGGGTGQSKNTEYGAVAAHVFTTAGTYNVTLTAYDGTSTVSSYAACTITVTAADTTYSGASTTCVAQSTLPVAGVDGCPSGAAAATQANPQTAVSTYCGSGKRLLFKHDDTFTGSGGTMSIPTGCYVDMYGTGAKPIISSAALEFSGVNTAKVANLDYETPPTGAAVWIHGNGSVISDILVYNDKFQNCNAAAQTNSVAAGVYSTGGPTRIMIVGNYLNNCGFDTSAMEVTGYQNVIMGNYDYGPGTSAFHLVRIPYMNAGVIQHNFFQHGNVTNELVSLRAPVYGPLNSDPDNKWCVDCITNHVVISDNEFNMDSCSVALANRPVNGTTGLYLVQDVINDGNYFHAGAGASCGGAFEIDAQYITVRNNIFDQSNTSSTAVGVRSDLTSPYGQYAHDVWIYNNTVYSSTGSGNLGVETGSNGTGSNTVTLQNNLGYTTGGTFIQTSNCASGCVSNHNTGDTGTVTTNPLFTNASGLLDKPLDFKPNTGSYAIGVGTSVPVWYDEQGVAWAAAYDFGAIKH